LESTITKELAVRALKQAIENYNQIGIIRHFDRGTQYTNYKYQRLLKKYDYISNMSRKGNCYDNACMESILSH